MPHDSKSWIIWQRKEPNPDQAFHQPYCIIKNRYTLQHSQADEVTMQMLILKLYSKEMLHSGLFQPLGKQTIPCVIATVAGFGMGS